MMSPAPARFEGSPTRLQGGVWGVRIANVTAADVHPGDPVRVRSGASGKAWSATVGAVIDADDWGVTCATGTAPKRKAPATLAMEAKPGASVVDGADGERIVIVYDTTTGNPECPF